MHLLLVQILSQEIAIGAVDCRFCIPTFYQHGFCSRGASVSEVVQPLTPWLKNPFTDKLSQCQQLLPEQLLHDVVSSIRRLGEGPAGRTHA